MTLPWTLATLAILILGGANWTMPMSRLLAEIVGCGILFSVLAAETTQGAPRLNMAVTDWLWMALILLFAAHLIPLPPAIWSQLPGREIAVAADHVVFGELRWRPFTLDPDATLDSLVMLLPAFALYLAVRIGGDMRRRAILAGVVLAALLATCLGLLQLAFPESELLRFYPNGDFGRPIGFFTNRNHQAIFLLCTLPLCGAWLITDRRHEGAAGKGGILMGFALFVTIGVLITGSRSGAAMLPLVLAGTAFAWIGPGGWKAWKFDVGLNGKASRLHISVFAIIFALACGLIAIAGADNLSSSLRRGDVAADQRFDFWPLVLSASMNYWPLGSGIGTFLTGYEAHEPPETLAPLYLNHAHNEFLEILLESGVPGLVLALAGIVELATICLHAWRSKASPKPATESATGRLASIVIVLPILHSLVDYPLRTVTIASLFAIAAVLVAQNQQVIKQA